MTKYLISWTEEIWQNVVIDADSEQEAMDKFWSVNFDTESVKIFGGEVQEGVDVEEVADDYCNTN